MTEIHRLKPTLRFVLTCSIAVCLSFSSGVTRAEVDLTAAAPVTTDQYNLAPPANDAVKAASEAIQAGDLATARTQLATLSKTADTFHPEVLLVQLLFSQGMSREGVALLEKFASQEPRRQDVYLLFNEIAVGERRWFDAWNISNTGERLAPATNWSPGFAAKVKDRLILLKAISCEGRQDWKTGRDAYLQLSKAKDVQSEIFEGLGRTEYKLGNIDQAMVHFQKLRDSQKRSLIPEFALANLYEADGNVIKAEEFYQKAVSNKGATPRELIPAKLAFARFLIWSSRPADAKPFLENEITESSGSETERQFLLAIVARMEQRFKDAQEILSRLHQQDSTSFAIGNHLALVLIESEQESLRGRALQIAEVNSRNNPQTVDAWATLGYIQFRLGDSAAAEKSLGKSLQNGKLSRDAAFYLAKIKQSLGNKDEAKKLYDTAMSLPGPVFYPEVATSN
jgi:tetratricopeptide (TPR) repeat protein